MLQVLPKLESDVDENEDAFSSFFAFAFKFCLMVRLLLVSMHAHVSRLLAFDTGSADSALKWHTRLHH